MCPSSREVCRSQLYECFLGIEPHFLLWKSLFFIIKPQPSKEKPGAVRGTGIQLRPGVRYINVLVRTSNRGWHGEWFYCANP